MRPRPHPIKDLCRQVLTKGVGGDVGAIAHDRNPMPADNTHTAQFH